MKTENLNILISIINELKKTLWFYNDYNKTQIMNTNKYNDLVVHVDSTIRNAQHLLDKLESIAQHVVKQQTAIVWVYVPVERSGLLSIFYQHGYVNHHCTQQYFVLMHIPNPQQTPLSSVPTYGTAFIKVLALICRQNSETRQIEVLVVRERFSQFRSGREWKLVSGSVNHNETIPCAVEREVAEETGNIVKFSRILGYCHKVDVRFGQDEVAFCCLVDSGDNNMTVLHNSTEIAEYRWCTPNELDYLWSRRNQAHFHYLERQCLRKGVEIWLERRRR